MTNGPAAQVVLLGKCAAALLLANAAYLSVDHFKKETSLHDVEYLFARRTDTHVRHASLGKVARE